MNVPIVVHQTDHVKRIQRQTKGNPALTLVMLKMDNTTIDVDISPCIVDAEGKHFVPKRHNQLKGKAVDVSDPYELLWMRTESQKELKLISSIDADGGGRRKCMRVLKAALASKNTPFTQFHSSYIVKTAWLHTVDRNKSKDKWMGWEVLAIRLGEILEEMEIAFQRKELTSFFNREENILSRFGDTFVRSCHGFLKTMNNKLRSGDIQLFANHLGLDGSGFRK